MKTIFIPAKSKLVIDKSKISEISKKLPEEIAIAYSVQYKKQAEEIRVALFKTHKINSFVQVLGCFNHKFPKSTNAIILISDGKFHAVSLAFESGLPVYLFKNNNFEKVSEQEIASFKKKKKVSSLKFLNADKIGIYISTKPGQQNLNKAIELRKKLRGKQVYLFIYNNINTAEFENFPEIQSWINTACPRIDMNGRGVVNMGEITKLKEYN